MKARGGEAHDEFLNAIPLYALDDRAFFVHITFCSMKTDV
jgi:hypothetical protein